MPTFRSEIKFSVNLLKYTNVLLTKTTRITVPDRDGMPGKVTPTRLDDFVPVKTDKYSVP